MLFSFGELGFQEFETQKYLTDLLAKNGFTIEKGVAGIPSAWTARWGSGKPVIALGSDVDDIPQASQKPGVGYHDPIVRRRAGTRRRAQLRPGGEHRRRAGGEGDHGAGAHPGHAPHLAGDRRGAGGHQGLLRPRRRLQGRGREPLHPRRQQLRHVLGPGRRQRPLVGALQVQGRERPRRRRALAGPLGAGRGHAHGHGLGVPPGAPAAGVALPLHHHRRRRPAQRGAVHGGHLVLLP